MNASRSRWLVSMPGLYLEHDSAERVDGLADVAAHRRTSGRGGSERDQRLEQLTHPKLSIAEAKIIGEVCPARNISWSWSCPISESSSLSSRAVSHSSPSRIDAESASMISSGAIFAPPAVRVKATYSPVCLSSRPRKSPAIPTGRNSGVGISPIRSVISSISSSGVWPGRSHFVDDGDDGDAAMATHLEQFQRLWFETLGGVDEHHRRVDGRQYSVGVLGEVGVAGVSTRLMTKVASGSAGGAAGEPEGSS